MQKIKPRLLLTYFIQLIPLGFSLVYNAYFSYLSAKEGFLGHPDGIFEYHNARNLVFYGKLESGPIINQLLNGLGMLLFGINYKVILYLQVIYNVLFGFMLFLIVYDFTRNLIVSGTISSIFIKYIFYFYVGPMYGKHYPLFMSLLLLSIHFLIMGDRAKQSRKKRNNYIVSSIFLALAFMTHIFVTFSVLIPVFYFSRMLIKELNLKSEPLKTIKNALITRNEHMMYTLIYAGFLVGLVGPYLLWRIITAGFRQFFEYPVSWGNHKYGAIINKNLWKQPFPFEDILYWEIEYELLKSQIFLPEILLLFSVGIIYISRNRIPKTDNSNHILLMWLVILILPFILGRVPPTSIYLYPLIPLILVISGFGLKHIFDSLQRYSHSIFRFELLPILMILFIVSTSFSQHPAYFNSYNSGVEDIVDDLEHLARKLPQKINILFRIYLPEVVLTNSTVLMLMKDIAEEDVITILNWTSEVNIAQIITKYEIDYYFQYIDLRWEKDYHNSWTYEVYGFNVRHYYKIQYSDLFYRVYYGKSIYAYAANYTYIEQTLGALL